MSSTTQLVLTVPAAEYAAALAILDSDSLQEAVESLARVLPLIREEAARNGRGQQYVHSHPICNVYAEKIAELTGARLDEVLFSDAFDLCKQRAKG